MPFFLLAINLFVRPQMSSFSFVTNNLQMLFKAKCDKCIAHPVVHVFLGYIIHNLKLEELWNISLRRNVLLPNPRERQGVGVGVGVGNGLITRVLTIQYAGGGGGGKRRH